MIEERSNSFRTSDTIKVLLADDSDIVRRVIRQILSAQSAIAIVGEAVNFAQAIQMASELEPHVIVLDLHMPDESKIPPREVRTHLNHGSRVLAVSVSNDDDSEEIAESLGAAVFLDKMDLAHTLIPAIMQFEPTRSAAA
jgi:DNA-binding NarL/FixJ family response regulator